MASSSRGSDLPRAFGRYLLFDCIGRGGMAEIYLARATGGLGESRRVVVKQILPELSSDPTFSDLLVREAKLAARLNHQNVVQVVDLGREDGRLFIAMAYVEGYDLNQLLRQLSMQRLPLPAEFALLIVRETLAALDYAHRASGEHGPLGIVHRDVSPSNVLVSFEGEVSLCDFGIARAYTADHSEPDAHTDAEVVDHQDTRIQGTRVVGKSAYMAPEHARGEEVDLRSDVFSAGVLLWELCAGRRMYKGTDAEMLAMAREARVPELPDNGLPLLAELRTILARALHPDPAQRYQSAGEMLADLDDYAIRARLMASQLRFGRFLTENFADEIVALRRAREQAARAALAASDMPCSEVEPAPVPTRSATESGPIERRALLRTGAAKSSLEPNGGELDEALARAGGGRPRWALTLSLLALAAAAAAFLVLR